MVNPTTLAVRGSLLTKPKLIGTNHSGKLIGTNHSGTSKFGGENCETCIKLQNKYIEGKTVFLLFESSQKTPPFPSLSPQPLLLLLGHSTDAPPQPEVVIVQTGGGGGGGGGEEGGLFWAVLCMGQHPNSLNTSPSCCSTHPHSFHLQQKAEGTNVLLLLVLVSNSVSI